MDMTAKEKDLLNKYMKVVKRMTGNFKRNYVHIDEGAFEGDLLERLCILIKNGAADNDHPDEYITACLRNHARTLVKKVYYEAPNRNIYVGLCRQDNARRGAQVITELTQNENGYEQVEHKELVATILKDCDKNQKDIAELVLMGYSFAEIARLKGVRHHSEITRSIRKLRVKIKNPFKN